MLRPTDVLASAVKQGRFMQKVLYSFFDELAMQLYETGGLPVEGEENSWIGVTERSGKTSIHMDKAWDILSAMFGEEALHGMASCSKTTLQNAVYAAAAYGSKKSSMDSLMGQLEDADAITRAKNSRSVTLLSDPTKAVSMAKEGAK